MRKRVELGSYGGVQNRVESYDVFADDRSINRYDFLYFLTFVSCWIKAEISGYFQGQCQGHFMIECPSRQAALL